MYQRFNQLSFVIGLFFFLVSLVLLGGYLFQPASGSRITLYTGAAFLIFGLFMMWVREQPDDHKNETEA
jgi:putative Ca2+/H+ antiporter (TMEM165/GDT1 family)